MKSPSQPRKGGRPQQITLAVVERVAKRFGHGMPLKDALALENNSQINPDSWHKALQRKPQFVHPFEAAKADFLEKALTRLSESEDLANLRWLLERRYPELFARPAQTQVNVNQTNQPTIVGLPNDILARVREYAKTL
jgi:hypothetical protein